MNKKMLNEILNIPFPLIQGGMMNIADPLFALAVCNAGGLGQIACGTKTASEVNADIALMKSLTNRPFGVNIMLLNPEKEAIAKVIADSGVKVVTTGAGNPSTFIPMWKEKGIIVIPVVASVAMALRVARAGADMVIVEGTEAGGHVGELTTLSLIPQVVDAIDIPVIAAGGIGDARSVRACLALGAIGVQVGTILLSTKECHISQTYKEALVNAKDTDTMVIGRHLGSPVRVLKTPKAIELNNNTQLTKLEFEQQLIMASNQARINGDFNESIYMAGLVCGMIKEINTMDVVIR
ncbi:MAG: NAD(P)H-dependent flavin oxidoreductase, partial [Bacilli bacterium]